MYISIAVGLAFALIGFSPAYAAHCNCNAKYPAKYHALKYTHHYYPSHQTMRVPYRVPCSDEGQGVWHDAPLSPAMDYKAERSLYCLVIPPIPGESQFKYDVRTIFTTRDFVSRERSLWLKDMKNDCDEARQAEPTAEGNERERISAMIASCHSVEIRP
jgi:hypothetical protein